MNREDAARTVKRCEENLASACSQLENFEESLRSWETEIGDAPGPLDRQRIDEYKAAIAQHAAVYEAAKAFMAGQPEPTEQGTPATDKASEPSSVTLPDQQEHETQAETERVTQPERPQTECERLQAFGPADIDDIIRAFKADNVIVNKPVQASPAKRARRKPGDIQRAAQAARQYLEQDGGVQPVEAVLAAVLDGTGLTVPETGKGRTRFLRLAGLQSRPRYRSGRTGCEYTEWLIRQDSQVQAITESASNPGRQSASIPPASASNPAAPERPHSESASNQGRSASNHPARHSHLGMLSQLLSRSRVSTHSARPVG